MKSQHQINLDGTSSIKVEKTTPKSAAIPMRPGTTVTHPSDITKMFRDVNSDKRQVVGPRIDLYESDSRKALIKSITSPMPRENWVEERMERDKKHFEERIVEVNLKLGIAKKIGEAEDEGYISRNDAKEMRQSVGLMHRGMTVKTRDTLLEIASDPNQPEIRRNCAIAKLFTE